MKTNQGNYEDRKTYLRLKKTRIMLNTYVEIRKNLSDGSIYLFSYGHLTAGASGVIDRAIYKMLIKSDSYKLINGWIVHLKTNNLIRKMGSCE